LYNQDPEWSTELCVNAASIGLTGFFAGLENTCSCRRVRKCRELLLFPCTLVFSGRQLYDTNRFCPSACIGAVLNPSSLREDSAVLRAAPPDEQTEGPACLECMRKSCFYFWVLTLAGPMLRPHTACCNRMCLL